MWRAFLDDLDWPLEATMTALGIPLWDKELGQRAAETLEGVSVRTGLAPGLERSRLAPVQVGDRPQTLFLAIPESGRLKGALKKVLAARPGVTVVENMKNGTEQTSQGVDALWGVAENAPPGRPNGGAPRGPRAPRPHPRDRDSRTLVHREKARLTAEPHLSPQGALCA